MYYSNLIDCNVYAFQHGCNQSVQLVQYAGVYISLHSKSYHNNYSYISAADIGEGSDEALNCFTDLTQCCSDSDTPGQELGQWFYPNGSAVGLVSDGEQYYVDRGPSVVSLKQRNNRASKISPTSGQLCCEIPDATSTTTRICVTIRDVTSIGDYSSACKTNRS